MAATPPPKQRGTSKGTQAAAGIAGALAFLGIGWAMGARATAKPQLTYQSAPLPTAPTSPTTPGQWGDDGPEDGQWGTIPQQGGVTPAQPGTGIGTAPPQTGTAGSGLAAAPGTITGTSIGTSSAPISGTSAPTTTGAAPAKTGPVGG
jgi:hypothetical protein